MRLQVAPGIPSWALLGSLSPHSCKGALLGGVNNCGRSLFSYHLRTTLRLSVTTKKPPRPQQPLNQLLQQRQVLPLDPNCPPIRCPVVAELTAPRGAAPSAPKCALERLPPGQAPRA